MLPLSTRTKNAIKPALAVAIAYGISLGMGWRNPYWAGFAVAMISLSTAGQSLNKGTMRMLGTLGAAAAALGLIAGFAQDRWWFIAVLSVYIGFCTYMMTGNKRQYFWYCCAFVSLVIASMPPVIQRMPSTSRCCASSKPGWASWSTRWSPCFSGRPAAGESSMRPRASCLRPRQRSSELTVFF